MKQFYSKTKMGIPFGGDVLPIEFVNGLFRLPRRNGAKRTDERIKYNNFDAYRDLMWRACEQRLGRCVVLGKHFDLVAGQFVATFSQLAADWLWHRSDVKAYLMRLQEAGFLSVALHDKFCIIDFTRYAEGVKRFIAEHPQTQAVEEDKPKGKNRRKSGQRPKTAAVASAETVESGELKEEVPESSSVTAAGVATVAVKAEAATAPRPTAPQSAQYESPILPFEEVADSVAE